jgi:hypothetical protein
MHSSETATLKSGWDLIKLYTICTLQVYTFIFNKLNIIALILTKPCKIRIFIYQITQSVVSQLGNGACYWQGAGAFSFLPYTD